VVKKNKEDDQVEESPSNSIEEIIKKYGNIITDGKFFVDNPKKIIPVSPALDIILGGGIAEGSFVVLAGAPKSGKTALSLHFAGNAQQLGRKVFYLNIEGRIKERDLSGIKHLDMDKLTIIRSIKGKILTAEEFLRIARQLIIDEPNSIIILDSVSQLCTEKEGSSDIGDVGRNNVHISLGTFCRQIAGILPINNNIVIAITHLIANTSGYGSPFSESGGNKIKYQVDVKLRVKKAVDWSVGQDKDPFGIITTWETEATSGTVGPGRKAESYLRFGLGLDCKAELVIIGINTGFIEKKASWYTLLFLEDKPKAQGLEGVIEFLNSNPLAYTKLNEQIQNMFNG
jgi:RecA/RadA recombinase